MNSTAGSAPGVNQFTFSDPRGGAKRAITVYVHRPAAFTAQSPVLMVMHGLKRNGAEYRSYWAAEAEKRGVLVIAPEFPMAQYAHPHEYNYGAMCRADGTPAPRAEWLFPVVDAIFREVRARVGTARERYFLFGHSAGAQLVHRLVTFGWSPSIERAVCANSGSYTMPVRGEAFPFGLDGMPMSDADLRALYSRPMVVLLGDRDNDPADEHLPREPEAMRQGPHRFARGHRYMQVAHQESARLGVPLAWRLAIAPGVAHSGHDMAPFAARELFG